METSVIPPATDANPVLAPTRPGRCPCCGARVPTVQGNRPITILDGMILVAAMAVAFVIARPATADRLSTPLYLTLMIGIGSLTALTPAVFLLRLLPPRPTIRRLSRRPGFAASLAGTAILTLGVSALAFLAVIRTVRQGARQRPGSVPAPVTDPNWWLNVIFHFGTAVGPAVLAVWLLLALSGRRRPSRDWLDALGRILGAAWITLFILNACIRLWSYRS